MRNGVLHALLISLFVLAMTACTGERQHVEQATMGYIDATSKYDIDQACQYCTEETAESLRLIKERLLPRLDTAYVRLNSQYEAKVTDVTFLSDTQAAVTYSKHTPELSVTDTLRVVKRDGRWLVDVHFAIPAALLEDE